MKSNKKQGLDFEKRLAKVTSSKTIIGSGALWFAKGDVLDSDNRWLFQCKTTKNKKYTLSLDDLKSLLRQIQDKNDGLLDKQPLFPWKAAFVINFSSVQKTFVLFISPQIYNSKPLFLNKSLTLQVEKLLQDSPLYIRVSAWENQPWLLISLENFLNNHHQNQKK